MGGATDLQRLTNLQQLTNTLPILPIDESYSDDADNYSGP
jgi:hypothetical protein